MSRVSGGIAKRLLTAIGDLITASAVGTPSRLALGGALQVLRVNAGGTALEFAAASTGAVTREGGNTTEATTTSTVEVSIISIASLSIAVATSLLIKGIMRKTAGAAAFVRISLRLNATSVTANNGWDSGADAATSGIFEAPLIYGVANYLRSGLMRTISPVSVVDRTFNADMPTATLTDIVIRGNTDDALVTLGVDELNAYSYARA